MAYLPLHGFLGYYRSLSVQAHSAVHQPTSFVSPSFQSDSSYLYGQRHGEWLSSLRNPPTMGHQPSIGRLPSFVHGSMQHVPKLNDGSFLMQSSGGVGGGVCLKGTSSSHQGDSKKIDLALKL
ncbi:zinc finger protein 3-like [Papaver somniferum]|uniref:zinc finger protein 3-like n=1 Tax=Papaver somniferum TaxID=3469 RepID=UPI000E6F71DF|nr:zinc finger protein 3-like [Papaver somniferum]